MKKTDNPEQEDIFSESETIYNLEEPKSPATTEEDEHNETSPSTAEEDEDEEASHSATEETKDPLALIDLNDPDTVKALRLALNIDAEVAAARAAGELAGRNAKIEQLLATPDTAGDGLPFHGSGCAPAPLRAQSIFQLANQAR